MAGRQRPLEKFKVALKNFGITALRGSPRSNGARPPRDTGCVRSSDRMLKLPPDPFRHQNSAIAPAHLLAVAATVLEYNGSEAGPCGPHPKAKACPIRPLSAEASVSRAMSKAGTPRQSHHFKEAMPCNFTQNIDPCGLRADAQSCPP
jgi:hypothetical protein